jgi:hypothetical protein
LSPVGRVGSSLVAWDANTPNDFTTLGIDVSRDGVNWVDISDGNGQVIPFINSQSDIFVDSFAIDDTATYTSAYMIGGTGSVAAWTVDTPNSRIVATGGSRAFLSPNSQSFGDGEIIVDSDYADFAGVVWRLSSDYGSCYALSIADSSSPRTPNTMRLFKFVNGAAQQLGLGATIAFTRGVPNRFKIVQTGGNITVTCYYPIQTPDGATVGGNVQTLSYTDSSPLAAGLVGLRSNGGTNHYSLLRCTVYGDEVTNTSLYARQRLATSDPLYSPQVQDFTVSVFGNTIDSGALVPVTTYSTLSGSTNTIAQDFDDLAKLSSTTDANGTPLSYWWRILQGIPYFQHTLSSPAPFVVTASDMLYGAKVTVNYNSDLYRNEAIIIGGTDVVSSSIIRVADGLRASFDTDNPVDSITSITINGQLQTFGIQGVDTGKQWYYQQGQEGITQDASGTPLADATQVLISYDAQVQVIAKARHEGQIALLATIDETSGVVTVTENASGLNSAAAQALALSRIQQYAIFTSIDLAFTTPRPGLHIGQLLTVYLSQHGLINQNFLITQVDYTEAIATINGLATLLEYYAIQCTSGPIIGTWSHLYG